ncbi:hypothetical protein AVEN_251104-1 [Araneus ventricosus]|uniref:Uncharacterized protein n=1 Tax=Araneus ventricosus TaxID=182803 RepID=A0A4Y2V0K3_ARAVE|nr:hypothetical protein AVEN_6512-1 [Araneus ventricosus]GBO18751.1 hypothetical protein AVEN_251104-1 [Araneus ventricosus]
MECRQRQGWTPDLVDHFDDKSEIPENAIIFSISPLGEEIYRMYWMIPCDVTTSLTRVYKRRQLKGGTSSLECEEYLLSLVSIASWSAARR